VGDAALAPEMIGGDMAIDTGAGATAGMLGAGDMTTLGSDVLPQAIEGANASMMAPMDMPEGLLGSQSMSSAAEIPMDQSMGALGTTGSDWSQGAMAAPQQSLLSKLGSAASASMKMYGLGSTAMG